MSALRKCDHCAKTADARYSAAWSTVKTQYETFDVCKDCTVLLRCWVKGQPVNVQVEAGEYVLSAGDVQGNPAVNQ